MAENDDILIIQSYIDGSLNDQERLAFEEKMKVSPDLADKVTRQKSILVHFEVNQKKIRKDKMLSDFEQMLAKQKDIPKPSSTLSVKWYAYAASITGILLVSLYIYFSQSSYNNKLYNHYYKPYLEQSILRGDGNNGTYDLGYDLYSNEQYEDAILKFNTLISNSEEANDELFLYLGNCYLNTRNIEKAISTFQKVPDNSIFHKEGLWYISLSYLKAGDNNNAIKTLNKLIENRTIYDKPARDLLNSLTSSK